MKRSNFCHCKMQRQLEKELRGKKTDSEGYGGVDTGMGGVSVDVECSPRRSLQLLSGSGFVLLILPFRALLKYPTASCKMCLLTGASCSRQKYIPLPFRVYTVKN